MYGNHSPQSQALTKDGLTTVQRKVLECLLDRGDDETIGDVAARAGVARETVHRYIKLGVFKREYKAAIGDELAAARGKMAAALIKGGTTPGNGQSSLQRLYWNLVGVLKDSLELTGPGGGPIEINSNVSVDSLPLYIRQLLVLVSNGRELDAELQSTLQAKLGPMFAEFLAERREQITANGGGLQPAAIEASYRVESEGESKQRGRKPAPELSVDDLESI